MQASKQASMQAGRRRLHARTLQLVQLLGVVCSEGDLLQRLYLHQDVLNKGSATALLSMQRARLAYLHVHN